MCLLLAACWATNASAQDEGSPRSQARSEARAARMQQRGQIPAAEKSRSRGKQEKAAAAEEAPAHSRATRLERLGDRAFITSRYDKAMKFYERASSRVDGHDMPEWLRLELKMARVYNMLQDPENSAKHYTTVYESSDSLLDVDDACTYIDALRLLDRTQQAEVVARHYAFRSPHSRNQRFLNTLYALSNQQHYYNKGEADYAVRLLAGSTAAEYWLGEWDGRIFCAASQSRMLDPRKVFFHRTEYFSIGGDGELKPLRDLPREVQNGAAASEGDLRVVTGINYRGSDRIHGVDVKELFRTQLFYTVYNARRGGWSALQPLFEHQEEACYAHPVLLDGGRMLLFASDLEGGYGGMDLYVSYWNEQTERWSDPENLGSTVNTEGDEIFPSIIEDELYFASNGQEGYGGYDIYRVNFVEGKIMSNSLWHLPYPINSVYNDYGMMFHDGQGYFISDRRGLEFRDDIYTFENARTSISGLEALGVSREYLALNGALTQVTDLERGGGAPTDDSLRESTIGMQPEEGEILLTLYYDFDRWELRAQSAEALRALAADPVIGTLSEVIVVGYADEMGAEGYNQRLSEQRARAAAEELVRCGMKPRIVWEGRGRTAPDAEDYRAQMEERRLSLSGGWNPETPMIELPLRERIELNRTARRVDIIVKKQ